MAKKDWTSLGQLMYQSHNSLKNDYRVSCDELDYLVELSQNFDGVYGANDRRWLRWLNHTLNTQ